MREDQVRTLIVEAITQLKASEWSGQPWDPLVSLRDLGVSSLMLYEFVSVLESAGDFVFDDADVDSANFVSLGSVAKLLANYTLGGSGPSAH
jgi:acyl carrier protein